MLLSLPLSPSVMIFMLCSHGKSGKGFAGIAFPLSPPWTPAPSDRHAQEAYVGGVGGGGARSGPGTG